MKNIFKITFGIIICLFVLRAPTVAQIVITPSPVSGFQFSSLDMLKFQALYTGDQSIKVVFTVSISDGKSRPVVAYESHPYLVRVGLNLVEAGNFKSNSPRYFNKDIAGIERRTRFLPPGEYTYCITVRCIDLPDLCAAKLNPELNYEACGEAHSAPPTPLLLSMPENESVIDNKRPTFSWIPPMPVGSDPEMRYTFTLVKMNKDQTAEDAIRRNRPLHFEEGIQGLTRMFPTQLDDLKEGEHYAWQISAKIGKVHIATSEIWEFEIEKRGLSKYLVSRHLGLERYQHELNNDLELVIEERYKSIGNRWTITLKDETSNTSYPGELNLQHPTGLQNLLIPNEMLPELILGHTYVITLENHKGDKLYTRITCIERKADKSNAHKSKN